MRHLARSVLGALSVVVSVFGAAAARADSFAIADTRGSLVLTTTLEGGPPSLRLPPNYEFEGPGLLVIKPGPFGRDFAGGTAGDVSARDLCLTGACAGHAAQSQQ